MPHFSAVVESDYACASCMPSPGGHLLSLSPPRPRPVPPPPPLKTFHHRGCRKEEGRITARASPHTATHRLQAPRRTTFEGRANGEEAARQGRDDPPRARTCHCDVVCTRRALKIFYTYIPARSPRRLVFTLPGGVLAGTCLAKLNDIHVSLSARPGVAGIQIPFPFVFF